MHSFTGTAQSVLSGVLYVGATLATLRNITFVVSIDILFIWSYAVHFWALHFGTCAVVRLCQRVVGIVWTRTGKRLWARGITRVELV